MQEKIRWNMAVLILASTSKIEQNNEQQQSS
jgi:hypothetical protein